MKQELKQILKLAWPLLIAQITQTLMGVSDTIMAGHYSATDMAAVAIGYSVTLPVLFCLQGMAMAIPPIVSRMHGAGNSDRVANITQQCFYLVLGISLLIAAGSTLIPYFFAAMDIEPELAEITTDYTQYILYSAPAFCAYQVLRNFCEGLSNTRPTMVIMFIGLLVNIPANYVLIYGKFGLPAMGGAGCGLATGLVFVAMAICSFIYVMLSERMRPYGLFARLYTPVWNDIVEVIKTGVPIALTILFEVILFSVAALLLSPYGSIVVASHQVALNFSSLMFMIPLSIGMATSIRVGYLLGESRPHQAKEAVSASILIGVCTASFTAFVTFFFRDIIAGLYSSDIQVMAYAASLMLLAAMFQFSDAIQVISAGALRGYKDMRAMLIITFVAYWLIGLPIGYILSLTDWLGDPMEAHGFWIGFILGLTSAAVMLGLRLKHIQTKSMEVVSP